MICMTEKKREQVRLWISVNAKRGLDRAVDTFKQPQIELISKVIERFASSTISEQLRILGIIEDDEEVVKVSSQLNQDERAEDEDDPALRDILAKKAAQGKRQAKGGHGSGHVDLGTG